MPERCVALLDLSIAIRKEKGMTQRELAKAAHLAQSAVARLESKKTMPQIDTLIRILEPMGYTLEVVKLRDISADI